MVLLSDIRGYQIYSEILHKKLYMLKKYCSNKMFFVKEVIMILVKQIFNRNLCDTKIFYDNKGARITSDTESVLLHSFFLKSFLNDQNCQQSKLGQTFQLDATNSLHWCRPVQSKYKGLMLDKRTLPYSKREKSPPSF